MVAVWNQTPYGSQMNKKERDLSSLKHIISLSYIFHVFWEAISHSAVTRALRVPMQSPERNMLNRKKANCWKLTNHLLYLLMIGNLLALRYVPLSKPLYKNGPRET